MGKNQSASNLTNIIKQDASGSIAFMHGNTMLMSISSSGAIATTGNVAGTASYASNAELFDGLDSTVFTLTSSFAAQTASFTAFTASQNILNGTYATTGSNTFTGIQTVNSNLIVTGSITAQTLVVQTITSSVDFVTGSTRFGSILGNTHVFSGSVTMNPGGLFVSSSGLVGVGTTNPGGSLEVYNSQNTTTILRVNNPNTGTSAQTNIQLGNVSGSNVSGFALFGGGFTNTGLYLADGLYMYNNRARGGITIATEQLTDIILATNATERWRLSSTGGVVQKTGSFAIDNGVTGIAGIFIQPEGTNSTSGFTNIQSYYGSIGYSSPLILNRYGGNVGIGTSNPTNILHISGSGTNTQTLVLEGSSATANAYVVVKSASKMYFSGLSSDQSNNFIIYDSTAAVTRMAITSGGNVGIGTTTPLSPLTVFKTTDAGRGGEISIVNGGTSAGTEAALNFGFGASSYDGNNGNAQIKAIFTGGNEVTDLTFTTWTGGAFSEKMRIMGSGNVGINTTSPAVSLHVNGLIYAAKGGTTNNIPGFQVRTAGGGPRIQTYGLDADQNAWMGLGTDMAGNPYEHSLYFSNPGSGLGRQTIGSYNGTTYSVKMTILVDGSIGAPTGTNIYNPSDVRLKQNVTTITNGLDKITALNPVKFNWVENFSPDEQGKDMLGFIAQEVQNIVPEAVEGFSDGSALIVGETTVENPLRVNEKFIIPVLVKAIQELKAENDTLKEILQRNNIQ